MKLNVKAAHVSSSQTRTLFSEYFMEESITGRGSISFPSEFECNGMDYLRKNGLQRDGKEDLAIKCNYFS
jgi:hypothetical protein